MGTTQPQSSANGSSVSKPCGLSPDTKKSASRLPHLPGLICFSSPSQGGNLSERNSTWVFIFPPGVYQAEHFESEDAAESVATCPEYTVRVLTPSPGCSPTCGRGGCPGSTRPSSGSRAATRPRHHRCRCPGSCRRTW